MVLHIYFMVGVLFKMLGIMIAVLIAWLFPGFTGNPNKQVLSKFPSKYVHGNQHS